MTEDEKYMQAALKLALRGRGAVEPNPLVGAVIVHSHRIIGKGFHKEFGQNHAEVNAIEDCAVLGAKPAGATMYVTLEPCCHFGKTPPCTEAIIKAGIKKVVAAVADPADHVSGQGLQQLREAGIEVVTGVCEQQARLINADYFKYHSTGLPWVILKWAQSIDGKLTWRTGDKQQWISNEKSRKDAHKLRRCCQAILVGVNTVIADDPLLTPRPAGHSMPLRIVLDSNLRIPLDSRLVKTADKSPVLIMTDQNTINSNSQRAEQLKSKGAQILPVPCEDGKCDLKTILGLLGTRGVQQLLVEGGPTVLSSFLAADLADAVQIYIAPKILAAEGSADISSALNRLTTSLHLKNVEITPFADDARLTAHLH